jgi:hypothetical protein
MPRLFVDAGPLPSILIRCSSHDFMPLLFCLFLPSRNYHNATVKTARPQVPMQDPHRSYPWLCPEQFSPSYVMGVGGMSFGAVLSR